YNGSDFGLILDAISGQETGSTVAGKWQAYSLYSKVALSERTRLVGRYEIFDDRDSGLAVAGALSATGAARQYQSVTLGLNRDLSGGLELRFEARQDIADQSSTLFKDSSGASTSHQETFSLGLLFSL
ncbi:MAG: outer membrane beta-barrel protein, partial [Bdellovibrionaceae bacterium]|nr:outer membrane beta-barrel protein [Pseudobdellovibrionaceae bacterium]